MLRLLALTLVLYACSLPPRGAAEELAGPLADYVTHPDASYQWTVRRTGQLGSADYAELILTSQTWREIVWKHQMFMVKPHSMPAETRHALLFISGGAWRDQLEQGPGSTPADASHYVMLAELLRTPIVVLLHVPHQPILGGRYEDDAIAHTFVQYLETKDAQWPLLLPMVKSAVRGMDAAQEFASRQWSLELETFTVTGASKRGWTTWLTSAIDSRVIGLAPMVIDILNMGPQLAHQEAVWGQPSRQIRDYTQRGLHREMQSPRGQSLLEIVDPYAYRQLLTQPKLIVLGTNDPYWAVDALNLYWDDLAGDNYILYVPNNAHGLSDLGRVFGSLNALHQHVYRGQPLPQLSWEFEEQEQAVRLNVQSDLPTRRMLIWKATAASQDFSAARWQSRRMENRGGEYTVQVQRPDEGYLAVFAEAQYDAADAPFYFSTNLRVLASE